MILLKECSKDILNKNQKAKHKKPQTATPPFSLSKTISPAISLEQAVQKVRTQGFSDTQLLRVSDAWLIILEILQVSPNYRKVG